MNYKLLMNITDYIILFPVKWYNLINKIIYNATVYNNILIINKHCLSNLLNVYQEIINIMDENKILSEISENKDFYILYFKNVIDINIFKYWLNLITARACIDINIKGEWINNILNSNFYIKADSGNIYINQEVAGNNICVTIKENYKHNSINYEYNYFCFCERLKEKYLQNM